MSIITSIVMETTFEHQLARISGLKQSRRQGTIAVKRRDKFEKLLAAEPQRTAEVAGLS